MVKVFFFFFPVAPDGGALAIVPRSHRLPGQPAETLAASFAGGTRDGSVELDAMPNCLKVAPIPGGSYVMFDNAMCASIVSPFAVSLLRI